MRRVVDHHLGLLTTTGCGWRCGRCRLQAAVAGRLVAWMSCFLVFLVSCIGAVALLLNP